MFLEQIQFLVYYFFPIAALWNSWKWNEIQQIINVALYMQLDGWTEVQSDFDEKGLTASRVFTMVFIFLGHFIFTNIFIGVIITNISESTEHYEVNCRSIYETLGHSIGIFRNSNWVYKFAFSLVYCKSKGFSKIKQIRLFRQGISENLDWPNCSKIIFKYDQWML